LCFSGIAVSIKATGGGLAKYYPWSFIDEETKPTLHFKKGYSFVSRLLPSKSLLLPFCQRSNLLMM